MRDLIISKFKGIDLWLFIPMCLLVLIGVIMVYSSSSYLAGYLFDDPQHFLKRHLINLVVSIFAFFVIYMLRVEIFQWDKLIKFLIGALIFSLIYVLIFGDVINGAKGWIDLGVTNVQPAELAKLIIILYFSFFLTKKQEEFAIDNNPLRPAWQSFALILFILFLIFLQPDMGSILIIAGIVFSMYLASGIQMKYVGLLSLTSVGVFFGLFMLIYNFGTKLPFLKDYQYERFLAFWDPFALSDSAGLQLVNSYYALSRGGLFGVGLGESVQKTGYLPEPYTDFIVSIIGEETGLLGILILFAIYIVLVVRIFQIAIQTKETFYSLVSVGIGSMFLIQAIINVGGVIGVLPITGVTFPFISYGGTSLIISCVAIAIVLNISYKNKINKNLREEEG